MKVHEILRKIRRDKDLSQQNLADALGIDVSTYNRYEKNGAVIQVEQLEKIAEYYKLTVPELYSYGEDNATDMLMEDMPKFEFKKRRTLTISIELDGEKSTLDYWFDRLKKVNAALA